MTPDWSLPFAARYHAAERDLLTLPHEIVRLTRQLDALLSAYLQAQRAMRHMQERDADQLAALRAHHAAVRAALRALETPDA